jgi:hypothetical protein
MPGTLTARWTDQLYVGSTGLIVVELRALSDFPEGPPEGEVPGGLGMERSLPVYVAEGEVELTLRPLRGLRLLPDEFGEDASTQQVTVERGTVAEAIWSVEATAPGVSGVVLTATRLTRANPDEALTLEQLAMIDLDDLRTTLKLEIEGIAANELATAAEARRDAGDQSATPTGASAPAPSSPTPSANIWPDLAAISQAIVIVGAVVTSLSFVLWAVASELDRRGRSAVAARVGWLPRKLLEFKSRGEGSASRRRSGSD